MIYRYIKTNTLPVNLHLRVLFGITEPTNIAEIIKNILEDNK